MNRSLPGKRDFGTSPVATCPLHQPTTPPQHHVAAGAHSSSSPKMTYQLPPMLLNLFAPRPPLRWVEPSDHAPEKRCTPKISGIGQYLQAMKEYKDNDGYVPTDSWLQKRDRKKLEKKEKQEKLLSEVAHQCTSHGKRALSPAHANTPQTNPAKTPRSRATLSRPSSYPALPTASRLTISSANSVATVRLSASASSRISLRSPTRRPRSACAATRSSCTSARKT